MPPSPGIIPRGERRFLSAGAFVQGGFTGFNASNTRVLGYGVLSGNPFNTPVPNRPNALLDLCGDNVSVSGVSLINAVGSNIIINNYWTSPCAQRWRGAKIFDVKILSTWWFSDDGAIAGPGAHVSNCFVMVNDDALKPMQSDELIENSTVWQGFNGWSIMAGWNTGHDESGSVVRNIHVIHVGHTEDGYCYPCDPQTCSCSPVDGNGYCLDGQGNRSVYDGYRAVIGLIYGTPGVISRLHIQNVLVSGPYVRSVSIGVTHSCFAKSGELGAVRAWTLQNITFEYAQKQGLRSKIWATGNGSAVEGGAGTVANVSFVDLSIGGVAVRQSNFGSMFAIGSAANPHSVFGGDGNVDAITFEGSARAKDVMLVEDVVPLVR
jgi:hypothetical protein